MIEIDRRSLLAGAGATALTAAWPARAQTPADTAAMRMLDQTAESLLVAYPENAANLGIDTGARAALKSRLTDKSRSAEQRRAADAAARLAALRAIDRAALSPAVALHVEVATEAHRIAAEGWRRMPVGDVAFLGANGYRNTPYVVSAGTGAFVDVPDLLETKHRVENIADAEAYLARIEAYAGQLAAETARVRTDAAAGVRLPGFLGDIAANQLRTAAAQSPADWSLVTSFGEKARKAGLAGDWQARAERLAAQRVRPALAAQAEALAAERAKASDVPGMWTMPGAADRYAWLVEAATTTRRTPEEIRAGGLEQCRALAAEIEPLLRAQGLTQGSVGDRLTALGKRPEFLFANTDAGRAELLAYLNRIVAKLRPRLPQAFGKLVRGNLEIRRVPPAIQDGAPNGYAGPGSLDGKTPGYYYINLKDTGIWPRYALPTLTFHEGIPGHIWQGEYTFDLPLIRTLLSFNAYSEGWALYAEQIGDELGFYGDDPLGRIGYLQSMLFRAARLVVDTGLHHKRWTMPQAKVFFRAATGYTESQATSELNRYCVWPGQALGYKTGHNEINRLRAAAKVRMGARYDWRAFNDTVVQTGGVPLGVLAQVVERWSAT
jgi:uncharacterized protein (DUF885 family)